MSLEELIRDTAKRGKLSYLSLAFNGREFVAVFADASKWGGSRESDPDPVKALAKVLKPRKPRADEDFG